MNKLLYIATFGCQMNDRDSEIMAQLLAKESYFPTDDIEAADAIIVNTCSIRDKAEQKAYSMLGSLRRRKKQNPQLIIAATGCVAQQESEKMLARMPHVDIIIGPRLIYKLPELFAQASKRDKGFVATEQASSFVIPPFLPSLDEGLSYKRFVTIMQGCNNYCTYCIVPYTRGREISRKVSDIVSEVEYLAAGGIKEVTLLGQNVNSYGNDQPKDKRTSFASLLRQVAAIDGLNRVRFTTSNPKDLSEELMQCFVDLDKLCTHFHLPVQAGSDAVLKRMNRKYTVASYLEKVEKLRAHCPKITITTDIIVGFPGETEEDFAATMDLIEKVRYHAAFSFKYSSRPPAKSCEYEETITEEEKSRRLAIFQNRQKEISLEQNNAYIGQEMELMIEGKSKVQGQWAGKSKSNHTVNFQSQGTFTPGQLVKVIIEEGCLNSLRAKLFVE